MLYSKMLQVMCSLVNQNVVCWFRSLKMFYSNLIMMMESIFSFLPSYFSIMFLAKSKISKSTSLLLGHIGPKRCWPIRFQDFKSIISPEQSDVMVYFFTCWYRKLKSWQKNIGVVVVRNGCNQPGHKMNGWMNWVDILHAHTWCQES